MEPTLLPTPEELQAKLRSLSKDEIAQLAERSGVPFMTLWNYRAGGTNDPRLSTVRKILPHLQASANA
jgi:predicted transcriptional regulator